MTSRYYFNKNKINVINNLILANATYIGKYIEKKYVIDDKIIIDNGEKILIRNKKNNEKTKNKKTIKEIYLLDDSRITLGKSNKYKHKYIKISGGNIDKIESQIFKDFPFIEKVNKLNIDKIINIAKEHKLYFKNIDKHIYFIEDYNKYRELNAITDYFNERCRIKCKRKNEISPLEYYEKNKEDIDKILDLHKRRKIILNQKPCTLFRITVAMQILKYFKAERWLDMSAGWGDRLIASILMNLKYYTGVDPNPCVHNGYEKIRKAFGVSKEKFNTILSPFEEVELDNKKYDLFFSSPPFFDKEIYIDKNKEHSENQSYHKYSNVDDWVNLFMIKSIKLALKNLDKNGHIVLYIEDPYEENDGYVKKFIEKMKEIKEVEYIDVFYYIYSDMLDKLNSARTMFVWKKIE